MDASSPGFITGGVEGIEITDKTPEPFIIRLDVGSGSFCKNNLAVGLAALTSYEERSSKVDLTGVIRDERRSPLSNFTVTLIKDGMPPHETASNDEGEFEFAGLEPGKYVLRSPHEGYWDAPSSVWITRQKLARVFVTLGDKRRLCRGARALEPQDSALPLTVQSPQN